jgi:hypothetical protein
MKSNIRFDVSGMRSSRFRGSSTHKYFSRRPLSSYKDKGASIPLIRLQEKPSVTLTSYAEELINRREIKNFSL